MALQELMTCENNLSGHCQIATRPRFMPLAARLIALVMFIWFSGGPGTIVRAQTDVGTGLDVFPNLSLGGLGSDADQPGQFSAQYQSLSEGKARLTVTAVIEEGWHVYSTTQPNGGPTPTSIQVASPSSVKVQGEFAPDAPPLQSVSKAWPGLTIEEHEGTVVWSANVDVPQGFAEPIQVAVRALVCKTDGACVPVNEKLTAKLVRASSSAASPMSPPPRATQSSSSVAKLPPFRDGDYVVEWTGRVEPSVVKPGQVASLILTAKPDADYHVYAAAVDDRESSTNIVLSDKAGLQVGTPVPSSKPISEAILPGLPPIDFHSGEVTWTLPILIPESTGAGEKTIQGSIGYQACTDRSCLPPKAIKFTVGMTVEPDADPAAKGASAITFATAPFAATLDAAAETKWVDEAADKAATKTPLPTDSGRSESPGPDAQAMTPAVENTAIPNSGSSTGSRSIEPETSGEMSDAVGPVIIEADGDSAQASGLPLLLVVGMAVLGGLILNLMPCVLPVVGLKVMSFAEQAGESRARVLMLNVWYTLGILTVFWALAIFAIFFNFSWGQQFTYFEFRFAVTLLVFAMALSFLGVWEIPIPGFIGGQSTQRLQRKEGVTGAFFKGIFTTMLATPCSGPLLGSVFAFTLGKSALVTSIVFTAIGFGMALPYLLIAIYPSLLAYFPKPGGWMDTFKQLLAFLLLGTVVYLFGGFSDEHRMPVFASLIGVWFGCWLIGQAPAWTSLQRRLSAWSGGLVAVALVCFLSFQYLVPRPAVLPWEPYDEARLQQLQGEGKTVLIDFTAKWCVNCIVNYNVAINTEATSRLVEELDAVPMLADWTDNNETIKNKLLELKSNSIPLLVIYPGRNPNTPIVLRDLVSQNDVLEALRKAGSSIPASAVAGKKTLAAPGIDVTPVRASSALSATH